MTTTINLVIAKDPDNQTQVGDLDTGTCYESHGGFWIKQEGEYSLALGSLRRYQVSLSDRVNNVYRRITVTVHPH